MTRTEERLADALGARAAAVREDHIRPLDPGGLAGPAWTTGAAAGARPSWAARLTPLAAVAAMLAAIVATIVAVREVGSARPPFADVGTASAPPPYYVNMDANQVLTVRSTASGQITDIRNAPMRWGGGGERLDSALAAAADGRTFVVVYHSEDPYQIGVYKFALTSGGQIADFALVRNGILPGMAEMTAAVSADGTRAAIAGVPGNGVYMSGWTHRGTEIVVFNLRTGRRATFTSAPGRHYRWLFIGNLSWTNGGRELAYLGRWCDQSIDGFNTGCAWWHSPALHRIQVTNRNGGRFGAGRDILRSSRRFPIILQAVITPDGRSVVALASDKPGGELSLVRFSASTGKPIRVLYRGPAVDHGPSEAFLSPDGSGRYFILDQDTGVVNGWVRQGKLHPLRVGLAILWQAPAW